MQVRCLHCHETTDVPDDRELGSVTCSACGGSFSLVGEGTASYAGDGVKTLGHFELLEQVGSGAHGSVWKARDTKLDRTVAVKVPRKGQLSATETEHFLREARAAAQLKHPNIVSVHEVGRDNETVYIVSDFVQGATLDDWLTERRLNPREAAELCVPIALALHHAHEAGVIHRDLKPSNIMLESERVSEWERSGADRSASTHSLSHSLTPKLVDFGLARREAGEATMTVEGRILGTPAYMSPEQARGEGHHADRRTDIYSLGVILFRLLTGELPFRGNVRMLVVQILHDDPPSPRKLDAQVPRDLETICLKCLEKDPKQRYPTALAVADELRRFLKGEPIQARPVGRGERVWRWCRRKPALASLTAALIVVLVGGLAGVIGQWLRAERHATDAGEQRDLAEKRRHKAHQTIHDYFTKVSEEKLLHKPGLQPLRKELLESALRYYQEFLREQGDDPAMRAEVAATYARVARINDAIGATDEALAAFQEALTLYDKLVQAVPTDANLPGSLARTYYQLGGMQSRMNRLDPALGSLEQARVRQDRLIREQSTAEFQSDLAKTHFAIGAVYAKKDQRTDAVRSFEQSIGLWRRLADAHPERSEFAAELAATHNHLGNLHYSAEQWAEALGNSEQARDVLQELVKKQPAVAEFQSALADSFSVIANVYNLTGRIDDALKMWLKVQAIREQLAFDNPTVIDYQWRLALAYAYVGKQHSQRSEMEPALACWKQALPVVQKLIRLNPGFPDYRVRLADLHIDQGHVQSKLARQDEALLSFEQARAILEELVRDYPDTAFYRHALGISCHNHGNELQQVGRRDEARRALERSRDLYLELTARDRATLVYQDLLIRLYNKLGGLHRAVTESTQARACFKEALDRCTKLQASQPAVPEYERLLAKCHTNMGDVSRDSGQPGEAERFFQEARARTEKLARSHASLTDVFLDAAQACRDLADLWAETGRLEDALLTYQRCREFCDQALQKNSEDIRPQSVLGQSWDGRGVVLTKLDRRDEARQAHRSAADYHLKAFAKAPKQILYRQRLSDHYQTVAKLHRGSRQPAEASAASLEQRKLWPTNPDQLFAVACDLASCIPLVGRDNTPLTPTEQAERGKYAVQALDALREALLGELKKRGQQNKGNG